MESVRSDEAQLSIYASYMCQFLQVAMRALDFPVKKADCRKLMEKYCKDGSDEVDKDEFMEIRM